MRKRRRWLTAVLATFPVLVLLVIWYTGVLRPFGFGRDTSARAEDMLVYYLDVGQGDSTLIFAQGYCILIDAGPDYSERDLLARLRNLGVKQIDLMLLTHPDNDHTGGVDGIVETFSVGQILLPKGDILVTSDADYQRVMDCAKKKEIPVQTVQGGVHLMLDRIDLELYAPNSIYYQEINDYSIAVKITYGETSFLFTGDAGETSEQEMLQLYGTRLQSTVYHAGHHGAATSSSEEFVRAVAPTYAVISCGAGNTYGHPRAETLDLFDRIGIQYYRTDLEGTILFRSNGIQVWKSN